MEVKPGGGESRPGEGVEAVEDADGDHDPAAALGDPEVSGAPVETDVLVVAEAREPLDRLEDFDGAGDCSAKLVAEGVGLAGGLTVAGISLESISVIFLPAMLWQSKVFLRSSTTLALMWTVPLMTPSVMVWTVWEILPRILSLWPPKLNLAHCRSDILRPRSFTRLKSMREVEGTGRLLFDNIENGLPFMAKTNSRWIGKLS